MEEFVELIQIYRYDRFERYGLQKPQELEIQFIRAVLLANLFLVYGRELKILPRKGGKEVDLSAWQLDEEIVSTSRKWALVSVKQDYSCSGICWEKRRMLNIMMERLLSRFWTS